MDTVIRIEHLVVPCRLRQLSGLFALVAHSYFYDVESGTDRLSIYAHDVGTPGAYLCDPLAAPVPISAYRIDGN